MGRLSIASFSKTGRKAGTIALPKEVFGQRPNPVVLAQAVRVFLSNQRQAQAKTLSRGEVRASKRKIYKQKGTGRARHGAVSAPIFIGGGIAHGPRGDQNYKLVLPKKLRKKAFAMALSDKLAQGKVWVADLERVQPKTRVAAALLSKIGVTGKVVIVHAASTELVRAAQNIKDVELIPARQLTTYQVLAARNLVLTKEAVDVLEERLKKTK